MPSPIAITKANTSSRLPSREERAEAWAAMKANPIPEAVRMKRFVDACVEDFDEVFPEPEKRAIHTLPDKDS